MIRTRLFNSSSWQRKKRATTPPKSPGVTSRISRLLPWTHAYAEDQKRINTFSKLNTRLRGIEDRLAALTVSTDPRAAHAVSPVDSRKKKRSTISRPSSSSRTRTRSYRTFSVRVIRPTHRAHRYKIGESFLHLPQARALKRLEKDQADIAAQLSDLSATAEECERGMKGLKVVLYAKFGRAINLDE